MTTFRDDACRTAGIAVARSDSEYRLMTVREVEAGDLLFFVEGELRDTPSRYTVQIGVDQHVDVPAGESSEAVLDRYFWRFMNHGCDPSAMVRGRDVLARRALRAGEDITFDYDTTEYEMFEPFTCRCGSDSCRGWVGGYKFLSPAGRARLAEHVSPHLLAVGTRP